MFKERESKVRVCFQIPYLIRVVLIFAQLLNLRDFISRTLLRLIRAALNSRR